MMKETKEGRLLRSLRSRGLIAGLVGVATILTALCFAGGVPKDNAGVLAPSAFSGRVIDHPQRVLRAGRDTIILAVEAPPGYHLTDEAPSSLCWYAGDSGIIRFARACQSYKRGSIHFPFKVVFDAKAGQTSMTLDANAFYCENKTKVCMFDKFRVKLPIVVDERGVSSTTLSVELEVLDEKTP